MNRRPIQKPSIGSAKKIRQTPLKGGGIKTKTSPKSKPKNKGLPLHFEKATREKLLMLGARPPLADFKAAALHRDLVVAMMELQAAGIAAKAPPQKICVWIDPGILQAASQRLGLTDTMDVVNAALALAAAPDPFKVWMNSPEGRLDDDFEPAV